MSATAQRMFGHRPPVFDGEPHTIVVLYSTTPAALVRTTKWLLDEGDESTSVHWVPATPRDVMPCERASAKLMGTKRGNRREATVFVVIGGVYRFSNAPTLFPRDGAA